MTNIKLFEQQRATLFAIAYRMVGSVSDAEDLVQETFLRWQQTQLEMIRSPKAYLVTIITRLCIDHLRRARIQREHYIGCWLPEPFITHSTDNPLDIIELADSLSIAFLVLLEHLSPNERAIFLLREVFGYDYSAISNIVGKSPANCRQIMRRVRQRLAHSTPQTYHRGQEIKVEQFLDAWTTGNLEQLIALMTNDIIYVSDGGGKASATHKPLHGQQKVARFLITIRRSPKLQHIPNFTSRLGAINAQPSIINYANGVPHSVMMFDWSQAERIQQIFTIVNPDKLQHIR